MSTSNRITEEDVLSVFRALSDPREALSTREVAEALDCSRRTAYERLSTLERSELIDSKKVGNQVRIWWVATELDNPSLATVEGEAIADLTASQTLQLELQSEAMAEPYVAKGEPELSVSIDEVVTLEDGSHLQYWRISGICLSAYMDVIREQPEAIDARVLETVDRTHRVEVHSTPSSLSAIIENYDGDLTGGTLEGGTLSIVTEFPATVNKTAFIEDANELYPDLDVASQRLLSTSELSRSLLKETVSDRQWTALQLAYYAGYFDRPRTSSGQELAERMGITRQTFNRHLRDAERRLVRFLMEDLDDDRFEDVTAPR